MSAFYLLLPFSGSPLVRISSTSGLYYDGIPAIGRRPANIPTSTFLGWGGNNEYQKQQRIVTGYDWTHSFNHDWKITNRFSYTNLDYQFINTYFGICANLSCGI
ncbi:MAG: hypothetical protein ABL903_03535 [Methylococcales bacterium]